MRPVSVSCLVLSLLLRIDFSIGEHKETVLKRADPSTPSEFSPQWLHDITVVLFSIDKISWVGTGNAIYASNNMKRNGIRVNLKKYGLYTMTSIYINYPVLGSDDSYELPSTSTVNILDVNSGVNNVLEVLQGFYKTGNKLVLASHGPSLLQHAVYEIPAQQDEGIYRYLNPSHEILVSLFRGVPKYWERLSNVVVAFADLTRALYRRAREYLLESQNVLKKKLQVLFTNSKGNMDAVQQNTNDKIRFKPQGFFYQITLISSLLRPADFEPNELKTLPVTTLMSNENSQGNPLEGPKKDSIVLFSVDKIETHAVRVNLGICGQTIDPIYISYSDTNYIGVDSYTLPSNERPVFLSLEMGLRKILDELQRFNKPGNKLVLASHGPSLLQHAVFEIPANQIQDKGKYVSPSHEILLSLFENHQPSLARLNDIVGAVADLTRALYRRAQKELLKLSPEVLQNELETCFNSYERNKEIQKITSSLRLNPDPFVYQSRLTEKLLPKGFDFKSNELMYLKDSGEILPQLQSYVVVFSVDVIKQSATIMGIRVALGCLDRNLRSVYIRYTVQDTTGLDAYGPPTKTGPKISFLELEEGLQAVLSALTDLQKGKEPLLLATTRQNLPQSPIRKNQGTDFLSPSHKILVNLFTTSKVGLKPLYNIVGAFADLTTALLRKAKDKPDELSKSRSTCLQGSDYLTTGSDGPVPGKDASFKPYPLTSSFGLMSKLGVIHPKDFKRDELKYSELISTERRLSP